MWYRTPGLASANLRLTLNPPSVQISQISGGGGPPISKISARAPRARLVWRLVCGRPPLSQDRARPLSPSCRSRLDPRRRVDLLFFSLSPLLFLLSLVLVFIPVLVFVISLFPHFLLPHRPRPRATRTLYPRRCLRNPHTSSRFDNKMAVVDLLPPRSGSYKVILISPFPPAGLVFRP